MTTQGLTVSQPEKVPQVLGKAVAFACAFCRRRLADEYFFTCLKCDASYCYIHMSRHQRAACSRNDGRRKRALVVTPQQRQGEVLPFVVAGSRSGGGSSANV